MIPSKTELLNQQFKYIEEAEKTAAVQKVLSKRQFGIRCLNIIYLFWCLRKLAIERLLSFDLKTRQLQNPCVSKTISNPSFIAGTFALPGTGSGTKTLKNSV